MPARELAPHSCPGPCGREWEPRSWGPRLNCDICNCSGACILNDALFLFKKKKTKNNNRKLAQMRILVWLLLLGVMLGAQGVVPSGEAGALVLGPWLRLRPSSLGS